MREELNNYGIGNPDGQREEYLDARRQKFDNDDPKYIKEDSLKEQKETDRVSEDFRDNKVNNDGDVEEKGADSELTSETSSASSTMASASASVGGSLGALAGVVAASVVAAVVVVAVFLSTLSINLSLVMAEMDSLVLEVQMTGAQEEDFKTPIYAVLTGDNDVYQEKTIDPDRLTIVFDDLQPGTQYTVTVKNDEKVFFESVYFTATEPSEKGEIISHMEGTEVFVTVKNAQLKPTEIYTLVAKDAQGNIVYQIDGIEAFTEYRFTIGEPKNLYFYLTVNGKTYAMDSIELPEYDFENGVWAWENDNLSATVTFADKKGGEDLVLNAVVTRKTTEATCEKDGSIVYTAKASYEGKTFTKKQTTVIESLGHNYEGTYEDGHFTYICSKCGDSYTDIE